MPPKSAKAAALKKVLAATAEKGAESRATKQPKVRTNYGGAFLQLSKVLLVICAAICAYAVLEKRNPDLLARLMGRPAASGMDESAILAAERAAIHEASQTTAAVEAVEKAKSESQEVDVDGGVAPPLGANKEGKPREVNAGTCEDRHLQCVSFASGGECYNNPGWMTVNCPKSCNHCHLLDPKVRCDRKRLQIDENHTYLPDQMNDMFSRIKDEFDDQYGVTVLSEDPYVVTFDNFLTDEEINALITSVDGNWERSTDTGTANEFGETGRVLSESRTSNNAWCREKCYQNKHVVNIMKKIEQITWVPSFNSESFQVLRYEVGQKYQTHHDASRQQAKLACGIRILTFFLYLSDVEEGGETAFPNLGISVTPKKGKALLWPSVLSSDPNQIDGRTLHEAKAVIKGTKFAANTWIHSHDYKQSNLWGCTGTFDELTE